MKEESNHLISSETEGFCAGCGEKLVKQLWSKEIKHKQDTGEPYQEYTFVCPNFIKKYSNSNEQPLKESFTLFLEKLFLPKF